MKIRVSGGAFLATALVACVAWLAFYSRGTTARELNQLMEREVENGNFSGVVLVSRGSEVMFERAYGYADVEARIPNTLDTKFRIASITKTFTAIVVMRLEAQRRLALTNSICLYLEECPPGWSDIKLHHLLSHVSGIFNYTRVANVEVLFSSPQTHAQVLARFLHEPLEFAAGEKFQYSNSNYRLLGLVIEKVTGKSYEAALREHIFDPLGMRDTGLTHDWVTTPGAAKGYWVSREGKFGPAPVVHGSWAFADGGIYSTAGDLMKYSSALDNGALLPREVLDRMWTPANEEYGLGWSTPKISPGTFNRRIVNHGGSLPGFLGQFQRVLDEDLTVIVLSNTQRSVPPRVANGLLSVVLDEEYVVPFDRESVTLPEEELRKYAGDYELDGVVWKLFLRDGRLFARGTGGAEDGPELELLAESEDTLFLRDMEGAIAAARNGEGEVTALVLSNGTREIMARKVR